MTTVLEEIRARIRTPTDEQRRVLLEELISELDGECDDSADPSVEAAWIAEARRRLREIEEGKVETIPGDQVFAGLRASLRR